ncbi:Disks large 1 tumor suppressor protein [Echinococcus granulosus]|uniref:Disks large 1 n=1 Tax=Echinococcus granulosus TaxID=6210 RepID=A0A068WNA6_ECHGR|nr:Disks large 1 tumor suppressor protein [Echinococcus granulosus]CDS19155.1 disks large 1 [Echinococcus granulosus]
MSSVSSPNKSSRRTYSSLSCVSKRPDSPVFDSVGVEPLKVIKRPTIGVAYSNQHLFNHRGSGATLDDASSLADQSSSAVSPVKLTSSKSSLTGTSASQSDLVGINYKLTTLTINQRESIYVRALFRYDPTTDRGLAARGLAFEHGDILYVVNASDQEWWQACYAFPISPPAWASACTSTTAISSNSITPPEVPSSYNANIPDQQPPTRSCRPAIIPSQRRVERRSRLSAKRVKFVDKEVDIGEGSPNPWSPSGGDTSNLSHALESHRFFGGSGGCGVEGSSASLSAVASGGGGSFPSGDSVSVGGTLERRKKPNSFSIFKRFSSKRDRKDFDGGTIMKKKSVSLEDMQTGSFGPRLSRTYEIVHSVTLKMARPLIIFGPLKERITEELLRSDEFATCIQHTSRPPQAGEVDGVDYHFYPSKAAMQADISSGKFLDVIVQSDHFYATSVQSILEVLQSGRICILDVNIVAIYRLQSAGLHPMSILLKPETVMQCRSLQRRLTVDQARRMHEACTRMESEYWYLFTAILNLESLDSALVSVNRVLQQHKGPCVWLPADQTLRSVEKQTPTLI